MTRRPPHPIAQVGVIAGRLCWLSLILVHLPALAGAGRSFLVEGGATHGLTALALGLTVFVFTLKLLGVRLLRFRTRRGGIVCFVLAAALAHHEVAISDAGRSVVEQTPAVLATGLLVEAIRRTRRRWRGLWRRMAAELTPCLAEPLRYGLVVAQTPPRPQTLLMSRLRPSRGPPA